MSASVFKVLSDSDATEERARFIQRFVVPLSSTESKYLSDVLGNVQRIDETDISKLLQDHEGYVIFDVMPVVNQPREQLVGSHQVLEGRLASLFVKRSELPEDSYFVDGNHTFAVAITHTYFDDGKRYCLYAWPLNKGQTDRHIRDESSGLL